VSKDTKKTSLTGVVQPPKMTTMVPKNAETAGATPRLTVRPPKPKK
jgi:hypothetical protein